MFRIRMNQKAKLVRYSYDACKKIFSDINPIRILNKRSHILSIIYLFILTKYKFSAEQN